METIDLSHLNHIPKSLFAKGLKFIHYKDFTIGKLKKAEKDLHVVCIFFNWYQTRKALLFTEKLKKLKVDRLLSYIAVYAYPGNSKSYQKRILDWLDNEDMNPIFFPAGTTRGVIK